MVQAQGRAPFDGGAPPAAFFRFSRDRRMIHPDKHLAGWQGILRSDVCGGHNDLCPADRSPGPVRGASCRSHARRKFVGLADISGNVRDGKPAHDIPPIAPEAVKRSDAIFDIGRDINGKDAGTRLVVRLERSRPRVEGLRDWLLEERAKLSKHNGAAKAIDYIITSGHGRQTGTVGGLHRVPGRRAHLPDQPRGRARTERNRIGTKIVALRWFGTRRGPRCRHVYPDRHRKDEWYRPASPDGRCPGSTARHNRLAPA